MNEKEFKGCDRASNLSETKVDIRRDFTQTFSSIDGNQSTRLHDGTSFNGCSSGGVPLAGAVPADYRYESQLNNKQVNHLWNCVHI